MLVGLREIDQTVAVLFGGRSSEHEVSLRSAVYVLRSMPEKYRIIPVGISRDGEWWSLEGTFTSKDFEGVTDKDLASIVAGKPTPVLGRTSPVRSMVLPYRREVLASFSESPLRILNLEAGVFFPVLHGPNGEDGRLQGVFELGELAYVGCDIRASVIGIDKNIQKMMARDAGVNIAKYEMVAAEEWHNRPERVLERVKSALGFPCFVKPNALGSAVGVNRATDVESLKHAINDALSFDNKILVEEQMVGTEVECAFLGTAVSPRITVPGEIAPDDFYSYDAKYLDANAAKLFVPARLETSRIQELREIAAKLASVFGLEGMCRIDFWNCTRTGRFVFNEINTIPGLTSISMFPKLWEHEGVNGPAWIDELIMRAQTRQKESAALQYGIHSSNE